MRGNDLIFYVEQADFKASSGLASRLVSFATEFGLSGNLWRQWVAYLLISDENPYSLACERHNVDRASTMAELARRDFAHIYRLFNEGPDADTDGPDAGTDGSDTDTEGSYADIDTDRSDNSGCGETGACDFMKIFGDYRPPYDASTVGAAKRIRKLAGRLAEANDASEFADAVTAYYEKYGAGIYGLYSSFRADSKGFSMQVSKDSSMEVVPVRDAAELGFDVLVGCEDQKRILRENTEAFISSRPANNVLLYGDSGTGKSTSVHALINEYADDGLRLIELGKPARAKLPELMSELKKRNYKFIIYMDDLSFEEDESDYKELKAMLEGALESVNDNLLIYATSNRRHLVRETWKDRSDMEFDKDVHRSDTMEEKLSLASRFGISIYYGKPDYREYMNIVRSLAEREGLETGDEELEAEARKWSLRHGSTSGRTASQLIKYLKRI